MSIFDDAAATWDNPAKIERSRRVAEAILARLELIPESRVLDDGCGTGQLRLHLVAQLGPQSHLTCADVSAPMIEQARTNLGRLPAEGPTWGAVVADVLVTEAGYTSVCIDTAFTVTKEVNGQTREFPLFLLTARKDS